VKRDKERLMSRGTDIQKHLTPCFDDTPDVTTLASFLQAGEYILLSEHRQSGKTTVANAVARYLSGVYF
jgi:tRNA A37 threonylcarbamoyladenosine biosynthesis protein TsaE